jgi:hypothetical protein
LNREDLFDGSVTFICRRQIYEYVWICTVYVKSSGVEESGPQAMNEPRTKKLESPVTRVICMTELHVLKENLHDV